MAESRIIVFDVNVIVDAAPLIGGDPLSWPRLPARTANPFADAIGAINDRREFVLWLSPHIIKNAQRVLIEKYRYDADDARNYLDIITQIAEASGGGIIDPPRVAHACRDHEDNLVLDLAAEVGADTLISNDKDLYLMPMWRGIPVQRPLEFSKRVDSAWRGDGGGRSTQPSTSELIGQRLDAERKPRPVIEAKAVAADYVTLRDESDMYRARIKVVVSQWNPGHPQAALRIEKWTKNLISINEQVIGLDALERTNPTAAQDAMDDMNARLDGALDKIDPRRIETARLKAAKAAKASTPQAHRITPPEADATPTTENDDQYGA